MRRQRGRQKNKQTIGSINKNQITKLVGFPYIRQIMWVARGCTLGIFGWGCAAGTLEPLGYTRACSSEFSYPIPD